MKKKGRRSRSGRLQISRKVRNGRFIYVEGGRTVRDPQQLKRIEELVIPPAWHDVEISASPAAKVQARGIDDAGRRQTIYHPGFRRRREREKFERLASFGAALPELRRQIDADLRRHGLPEPKVVAAVVKLLDLHFLRVGSLKYARRYKSFGATTLRRRHTSITSTQVNFEFTGKSGQQQRVSVTDSALVRVLTRLHEQPGYELFRFQLESGAIRTVRTHQVNDYLHEHLGQQYSAKDFRTWGGTLRALASLLDSEIDASSSVRECTEAAQQAVKQVAQVLGNTPTTARAAYIAPKVLDLAQDLSRLEALRGSRKRKRERTYQSVDEQCLLLLLTEQSADGE